MDALGKGGKTQAALVKALQLSTVTPACLDQVQHQRQQSSSNEVLFVMFVDAGS